MSWRSAAAAIAARQRSLITATQLETAGLGRQGRSQAVARRELEVVRFSVYRFPGTRLTWETAVLAAVLAAGDGAVASHLTAARLWQLSDGHLPQEAGIHVTAPKLHHLRGVVLHRQVVGPGEKARCQDVPVTSPARTLFDLACHLDSDELGRWTDEALRRRLTSVQELAGLYERHRGPGRRRALRVRQVVADRHPGYDPGANDWERHMDRLWDRLSLPAAERQHEVVAGGRRYRLDRAIVELRLAVEWVGAEYHTLHGRYRRDRRRTSDLIQAGWDLVEVTPDWTSDRLYRTVMAKVAERGALLAPRGP